MGALASFGKLLAKERRFAGSPCTKEKETVVREGQVTFVHASVILRLKMTEVNAK